MPSRAKSTRYDYIFPDEDSNAPNLKILEAAYKWKRQKLEVADAPEAPEEPETLEIEEKADDDQE